MAALFLYFTNRTMFKLDQSSHKVTIIHTFGPKLPGMVYIFTPILYFYPLLLVTQLKKVVRYTLLALAGCWGFSGSWLMQALLCLSCHVFISPPWRLTCLSSSSALARPALSLCGVHSAAHHADKAHQNKLKTAVRHAYIVIYSVQGSRDECFYDDRIDLSLSLSLSLCLLVFLDSSRGGPQ